MLIVMMIWLSCSVDKYAYDNELDKLSYIEIVISGEHDYWYSIGSMRNTIVT